MVCVCHEKLRKYPGKVMEKLFFKLYTCMTPVITVTVQISVKTCQITEQIVTFRRIACFIITPRVLQVPVVASRNVLSSRKILILSKFSLLKKHFRKF